MKLRAPVVVAIFALLMTSMVLQGCASHPLDRTRGQFHSGRYEEALGTLEAKESEITDRDKLLVYMDKGLILHQLGRYEDSNLQFLKAAELIEELDQVSISEQLSTLAINEWLAVYRGEYSEQLWVHTYLMMNFLLLDKPEGAAVEARRSLKVLNTYADPLKDDYFSRALIGLSFENVGLINDAYLEYKILAESLPDPSPVAGKLYQYATRLGFNEDAAEYKNAIPPEQLSDNKDESGELILFVSEGRIPRKVAGDFFIPPDIRFSWPEYRSWHIWPRHFEVHSHNETFAYKSVESDMASLARASLSERGRVIATKQVARAVTKRQIVNEVDDNNPLTGGILRLVLFALEEADTRGWDTLPGQLQLIRVSLPPGEHDLSITDGETTFADLTGVVINNGGKTFRAVRF